MSGITLHKKLGLNARCTFCPKCGGEGKELAMLGKNNHVGVCAAHGHIYGIGAGTTRCPASNCGNPLIEIRELTDSERVPASDWCDACHAAAKIQQDAVERGGIAWRCKGCKSEGAILKGGPNDAMIAEVRAKGFLGVELPTCPVCEKETEEQTKVEES
jgi:hypothetical protein